MNTKYDKLVSRIFWFALPLIIALFTWIILSTMDMTSEIKVARTEGNEREKLQEKIWGMVQTNNNILETKSDKQTNDAEHKLIILKIDLLEKNVNSILSRKFDYSFVPVVDTVAITVEEIAQKIDTACIVLKELKGNVLLGIYKEPNIVWSTESIAQK